MFGLPLYSYRWSNKWSENGRICPTSINGIECECQMLNKFVDNDQLRTDLSTIDYSSDYPLVTGNMN